MRNLYKKVFGLILLSTITAGCAVYPDYYYPQTPVVYQHYNAYPAPLVYDDNYFYNHYYYHAGERYGYDRYHSGVVRSPAPNRNGYRHFR